MIGTIANVAKLNYDDREAYKLHLQLINKIVCSYSRYEAFVDAVSEISAAAKYTVTADKWCAHNSVYIFDEEGVMTTVYLIEG